MALCKGLPASSSQPPPLVRLKNGFFPVWSFPWCRSFAAHSCSITCPGHCTKAKLVSFSTSNSIVHVLASSSGHFLPSRYRVLKRRAGVLSRELPNYYSTSPSSRPSLAGDVVSLSETEEEISDDEEAEDIMYDILDMEEELEGELEEERESEEDEDDERGEGEAAFSDPADRGRAHIRERVEELCRRMQAGGGFDVAVEDLASLYSFSIDKFQRFAIEGFLKGSSVVVCAPTSSGKTLIAECAAAATLAKGKRLFYTTPLKALSNQKLYDFRNIFGEENVGLITGDAAVKTDAPILIMTTEILRNMLYQSVGVQEDRGRLQDVCAIVLDEVHYLSDISRGTVWEETVIYCPKEVQLICLSATVANSDELAGWIAQVHGPTELITSRRRPVPLTWHFSTRYALSPLLNDRGTSMNRGLSLTGYVDDDVAAARSVNGKRSALKENHRLASKKGEINGRSQKKDGWAKVPVLSDDELQFLRRRQIPRVEETLKQLKSREMLPAIWFLFSRKGCDTAIKQVEHLQLLSNEEQAQVHEALRNFRDECPDAVRESAVPSLLHGFASHHAGCLPLWKSFIENLFQKGLIKVVFATETLAAGINMPARTTILASLSKRGDAGHALLSSNAMLQMAGRAGRRGLDEHGHVVLVQTPFEGAEEGCKLLFAGPDPLVSQFTASYGMVLNLLSCIKSPDGKMLRQGRTLEEARALIEKSFGNYVGNDVKVEAMEHVSKLEERITKLQSEQPPDVRSKLTKQEIEEYMGLKERLKAGKQVVKSLRSKLETEKVDAVQPILAEALTNSMPFLHLRFNEAHGGKDTYMSVVCVGAFAHRDLFLQKPFKVDLPPFEGTEENETEELCPDVPLYVALGSDNAWYIFSPASILKIFKTGLEHTFAKSDEINAQEMLLGKVPSHSDMWQIVGKSGSGISSGVWSSPSSVDTWSWSANVPSLDMAMDQYELPNELTQRENDYAQQRRSNLKIRKKMKATKASREYLQTLALDKLRVAKIDQLQKKRSRILARISQMQPSGWQEFLRVLKVLEETGAITADTHEMLTLGQIAAAFRGVNELWLAVAFSNASLSDLNPAQLGSVCASFVSEGIKFRGGDVGVSDIYKPSDRVEQAIELLREKQQWLLGIQNKHGVLIPCELDDQLAGLVEAWASGVSWKVLMEECTMDEGDLARLLRRSIDLLAQLQVLPNLSTPLHKTAKLAANVMDRSPISELIT